MVPEEHLAAVYRVLIAAHEADLLETANKGERALFREIGARDVVELAGLTTELLAVRRSRPVFRPRSFFLGRPEHQPTRLRRADVTTFTTLDRFDGLAGRAPCAAAA